MDGGNADLGEKLQMPEESTPQTTPSVVASKPPAVAAPVAEAAPVEQKIKVRKPKQRSCDEKDAKGKLCAGHLKRWYDFPKDVEARIGAGAEIYRCEFCKTLYKPDPKQMPHSFTLRY